MDWTLVSTNFSVLGRHSTNLLLEGSMHSTETLQKNSGKNFIVECIDANEREMVDVRLF